MGLIIDTNFFIDVENKRLNLDKLSTLTEYGEAYIAAITVSELLVGVHMAKTVDIRIRRSAFVEPKKRSCHLLQRPKALHLNDFLNILASPVE